MNKKLKITSINRSSEQGFAIPLAVGLGLIMILLGVTMVIRSQGDQVNALAQTATADSLAVAEIGLARVQSLLVKYPTLASTTLALTTPPTTPPSNTWQTEFARVNPTTCGLAANPDATLVSNITSGNWMSVDSSDVSKGEFKLVNYTYGVGKGKLKIEGRAKSQNNAITTSIDNSVTSLEVDIPVISSITTGIWVKGTSAPSAPIDPINVSTNSSIQVNVVVNGCINDNTRINNTKINNAKLRVFPDTTTPTLRANPVPMPSLPDLPSTGPASGLGAVPGTSSGPYFLPSLALSNCYIVLPRIPRGAAGATPAQARAAGVETGTNCTNTAPVGQSPGSNRPLSTTFDVTDDQPGTDGVYRYLIDSTNINKAGGDSIKLTSGRLVIAPPTGQKVVLYVRGNITLSGISNSGTPTTCVPYSAGSGTVYTYINRDSASNLEIYAADGSGKYGAGYKMDDFTVASNTAVHAFIYAPEAKITVSQAEIRGAVWGNQLVTDNASGCALAVAQEDVGNLSLRGAEQRIQPVQFWQRQEAQ